MGTGKYKRLIDRWTTPEFAEHLETVGRISLGLAPLQDNTLRTPDGRIDFRGFTFPSGRVDPLGVFDTLLIERRTNTIEWNNLILEHFDFTAATIPGWYIHNSAFTDCRFDHATCTNWQIWCSDITDCTFTHADLSGSTLGMIDNGQPTTFTNVDLTRADLRDTRWFDSDYHHVTFDNARLDRANFEGALLDHCTFAGRLKKVFFTDWPATDAVHAHGWHHVDLSNTTFDDTIMSNAHLETVHLPHGLITIPNAPVNNPRAAQWIRDNQPEHPKAQLASNILERTVTHSNWTDGADVFNPADLSDDVRNRILDALTALQLLDPAGN